MNGDCILKTAYYTSILAEHLDMHNGSKPEGNTKADDQCIISVCW